MAKAKKKNNAKIKTTHEERVLPCAISENEIDRAKNELVYKMDTNRELKEELAGIQKQFRGRIGQLESEISGLIGKIKDKVERRNVKVTLALNYTTLTAKVTRDDTKEVVEERPLTDEEKQFQFEFDNTKSKSKKAKDKGPVGTARKGAQD